MINGHLVWRSTKGYGNEFQFFSQWGNIGSLKNNNLKINDQNNNIASTIVQKNAMSLFVFLWFYVFLCDGSSLTHRCLKWLTCISRFWIVMYFVYQGGVGHLKLPFTFEMRSINMCGIYCYRTLSWSSPIPLHTFASF